MTTAPSTYALQLSDDELGRYRWMAARARAEEGDLWTAAGMTAGARVADVGCGPGAMLVTLAELVGPTGHVVGVDADRTAVTAARAALAAARFGAPVAPGEVRHGRAESTGLPPASVDTVVLRHVLAHNGRAAQRIVDHLATLVRPGGHVYLVDVDLTTTSITPSLPEAVELVERYVLWHERQGNDPRIGRRLPDLARAAGLTVEEYRGWTFHAPAPRGMRGPAWAARDELVRAGLADAVDVARWDAAFAAVDEWVDTPQRRHGSVRRSLPPAPVIEGGSALTSTSASHAAGDARPEEPACRVVRAGEGYEGRQGLSYAAGISAESAGAHGQCLHTVTIPPGARAKAHRHEAHESAIYTVSGRCEFWWGDGLAHCDELGPGDFVHTPPASRTSRSTARTNRCSPSSPALTPTSRRAWC